MVPAKETSRWPTRKIELKKKQRTNKCTRRLVHWSHAATPHPFLVVYEEQSTNFTSCKLNHQLHKHYTVTSEISLQINHSYVCHSAAVMSRDELSSVVLKKDSSGQYPAPSRSSSHRSTSRMYLKASSTVGRSRARACHTKSFRPVLAA